MSEKEYTHIEKIKILRAKLGVGLKEITAALKEANGDMTRAEELVLATGRIWAERGKVWQQVFTYNHGGRIATVVTLECTTDFAARTEEFQELGKNLAIHVAGYVDESRDRHNPTPFSEQIYIKEPSKTIKQLIDEVTIKTGEQIQCVNFNRYEARRD